MQLHFPKTYLKVSRKLSCLLVLIGFDSHNLIWMLAIFKLSVALLLILIYLLVQGTEGTLKQT